MLDEAHFVFRLIHVFVGFSGLVLFWVPLFARKGSRLHIRSGAMFCWCASFVAATGLLASVWGLSHPMSFFHMSELQSATEEQKRLAVEDLRFILSITGFLALGVLSGVVLGRRIMRFGPNHDQFRSPLLFALLLAFGLWSAGLAIYGAGTLIAAWADWHHIAASDSTRYWLNAILGVVGVYGATGDLRFTRGPQPSASERQAMHIECMIGAGAAFYAAFFLFGASRIVPLPGIWQLAATLTPLVIGSIAIKLLRGRYEPSLIA